MPWSWKIGRVRDIQIFVHITFLLIVAWAAYAGWAEARTVAGALYQVAFILALFGCIVLHELGHALMALRFGIKTRDITLLPIGGVARLERMPKEPLKELAVALAGPAVNVAIAAAIAFSLFVTGQWRGMTLEGVVEGSMLEQLMLVNIFLVLFNLLPAFPMDGGRALRALLATRLGPLRATRIAANVGQGMAVIFGLLGLVSNPFLVLIALFVWTGAAQEAASAQAEAVLGDAPVERAAIRQFYAVREDDSLAKVAQLILIAPQRDFPVLDEHGNLSGMLTRDGLLRTLSERGGDSRVAEAMQREFQTVEITDSLEEAFRRLQSSQLGALPAMRDGAIEGLLTRESLQAYLSVRQAMAQSRVGPRTALETSRPHISKV
jgi:Zn-dependent protease/CBS domain-containing protein